MSGFSIDEGPCGAGAGSYEAGLFTLPDGTARGVETIARLSRRSAPSRGSALPGFLGSLRKALPTAGRLAMPARLAVSTVRAGLGVIEEGLGPDQDEPAVVEIAFADGTMIVARMPPALIAALRRDREVALGALGRAAVGKPAPTEESVEAQEASEALTSIFRYEKRQGRLRRVTEPDAKG
ncbi:hypothetical protein [Methylobacterium gnaphalii]|uniref:Uncharacterized protein n=1 Tax=Methylobacterium gnaphalii TaxID=1010610 RepID=A0A512JF81_9HYPH|nr:hypothetical protein [Methylobacterium gnaphalii]GEP08608.1 hypothetical protein MGN01_04530 [Methylobacterium gnaphalii]GJD71070.1 hypothetical protein MMMDOFMJ_4024 [Methylobacterium gnaphalii]GLS50825.1 hypothetical protein GCM10007885_36790 [Methylobacterium gnaphalii]